MIRHNTLLCSNTTVDADSLTIGDKGRSP